MKRLAELQAAFQQAVRDGSAAPAGLLRGNPRGLATYQYAYRQRLLDALRETYEALHLALGDEAFDRLGHDYLSAHPPTEASIRWFGDALPAFLAAWPGLRHPALADLARMDWAVRAAFDAAHADALDVHWLVNLPPEHWQQVRLLPQPHAQLLRLHWAVGPVWQALVDSAEVDHPVEQAPPDPLDHGLLVWRQGLSPHWRGLGDAESKAWQALEDKPVLTDWLDDMGEHRLPQAMSWLRAWAEGGLLTRILAT